MTHTPKTSGIDDPRPHEVDTSAMDAQALAEELRSKRIEDGLLLLDRLDKENKLKFCCYCGFPISEKAPGPKQVTTPKKACRTCCYFDNGTTDGVPICGITNLQTASHYGEFCDVWTGPRKPKQVPLSRSELIGRVVIDKTQVHWDNAISLIQAVAGWDEDDTLRVGGRLYPSVVICDRYVEAIIVNGKIDDTKPLTKLEGN